MVNEMVIEEFKPGEILCGWTIYPYLNELPSGAERAFGAKVEVRIPSPFFDIDAPTVSVSGLADAPIEYVNQLITALEKARELCAQGADKDARREQIMYLEETITKPIAEGIYLGRRGELRTYTNVPHSCVLHSPTGFSWGYGGSGPGDLALNILEAVMVEQKHEGERAAMWRGTCFVLAAKLHQKFKEEFLVDMPHLGGYIPYETVVLWLADQVDRDLPEA